RMAKPASLPALLATRQGGPPLGGSIRKAAPGAPAPASIACPKWRSWSSSRAASWTSSPGFACLICMAARLTPLAGGSKDRQNRRQRPTGTEMRVCILLAMGLWLGSAAALAQPKSAGVPDPKVVEDLVAASRVL